jgi:hypothetical protein
MPKFINRWQMNHAAWPSDPEAQFKINMMLSEMVKDDLRYGRTKEWGMNADGSGGYAIGEGSEADVFALVLKYYPYILSDVKPVLTIDQSVEISKALMAAMAAMKK